ncbi:hypothetical protein BKA62DRAFT_699397 [Auriculariales sp. MPI-PUGE-AT-0066]|nr:hypothetical protein BKA62DRAFT_699397 [Auriculariales sp. MPI-PUGE-AT-0066]
MRGQRSRTSASPTPLQVGQNIKLTWQRSPDLPEVPHHPQMSAVSGLSVSVSDYIDASHFASNAQIPASLPNLRVLEVKCDFPHWTQGVDKMHYAWDPEGPGYWSHVHTATLEGYLGRLDRTYQYKTLSSLLHRIASSVREFQLESHGFDECPSDIDSLIPDLPNLRTLALSAVPLRLLTALLKRAPFLETLVIEDRLTVPGNDFTQNEPGEDNWDEVGSTASRRTAGSSSVKSGKIRPRHLARALLGLRVLNSSDGLRLKRLYIATFSQPGSPRECRLIAAGARILIGLAALSRLTNLLLDRWLFTVLMARDVALPSQLQLLRVLFSPWDAQDADVDTYGAKFVRVDQPFDRLGAHIRRDMYKKLRTVKLIYRYSTSDGRPFALNRGTEEWRSFVVTCRERRVFVSVLDVSEFDA